MVVLDQWRMDYNHRRPHGGLKWLTPAAFVAGLDDTASGASWRRRVVCLRSGLRPSLRHTTRTVPQLSHEHWYKNWGGVTPRATRTRRSPRRRPAGRRARGPGAGRCRGQRTD
ncbi:MAG: integrase core domain-containing protein [Planctomycetota bacterium]